MSRPERHVFFHQKTCSFCYVSYDDERDLNDHLVDSSACYNYTVATTKPNEETKEVKEEKVEKLQSPGISNPQTIDVVKSESKADYTLEPDVDIETSVKSPEKPSTKRVCVPMKKRTTFDCKVKDCHSRYLVQEGLDAHVEREHPNEKKSKQPTTPVKTARKRTTTFDCQMKDCLSRYLEQSGLDDHMKREHNPDGSLKENPEKLPPSSYQNRRRTTTYDCQTKGCHSRYLEQSGLDAHIERGHHDDGRPKTPPPSTFPSRRRTTTYDCQVKDCHSRYLVQSGLEAHMVKEHSDSKDESNEDKTSSKETSENKEKDNDKNAPQEKQEETTPKPAYVPRRRTTTYDCQIKDCHSRYLVEEGLKKHMENEHNADGSLKEQPAPPTYQARKRTTTFDCQIKDCHSRYLEKSGLDDHMEREHNPDGTFKPNPEKLPPPAYRYRRRTSTFDCQIKDCHSRYLEQSGLDDHMKREHNPDGSFKEQPEKLPESSYHYRRRTSTFDCQVKNCHSRYLEKSGLDQHTERGHYEDGRPKTPPPSMCSSRKRTKSKTFDCQEKDCHSRYLVQSGLDDHMKKDHSKDLMAFKDLPLNDEEDKNNDAKSTNVDNKIEEKKNAEKEANQDSTANTDESGDKKEVNNNTTKSSKAKRARKEGTYVCILCNSRFSEQSDLEKHHERRHPEKGSFLSDEPVDVTGLL